MIFSRRISPDEEQKNAVLVDKSKLRQFPDLGKEFKIKVGRKATSAHVNAVNCNCIETDKPHEHYYLHLFSSLQFKKGQKVSVSKGKKVDFELKISR